MAGLSAGEDACGSLTLSLAGAGAPVSSSVIAILKAPSTITTTLAATSSERIFEVMEDGSPPLPLSLEPAFAGTPLLSPSGWAAAACAARRAAAMKLAEETGGRGVAGISLIASSDAAIRS